MTMRSEFTDRVMDFGTDGDRVAVLFAQQAAGYGIPAETSNLEALVAALCVSWKHKRAVDVVAEGTRIVSVAAAA